MGYVYLIEDTNNNIYKIGVTKNLKKRLQNLQTGNSNQISIKYTYKTEYPFRIEQMLHNKFNEYKELNEWYNLPKSVVSNFYEYCEQFSDIINSLKTNPHFQKNLK